MRHMQTLYHISKNMSTKQNNPFGTFVLKTDDSFLDKCGDIC